MIEKSPYDVYLEGHNSCGIRVGDKVKIISKAESSSQGWSAKWADMMNTAVGKKGTVVEDVCIHGFRVRYKTRRDRYNEFNFPYFVLEKI